MVRCLQTSLVTVRFRTDRRFAMEASYMGCSEGAGLLVDAERGLVLTDGALKREFLHVHCFTALCKERERERERDVGGDLCELDLFHTNSGQAQCTTVTR